MKDNLHTLHKVYVCVYLYVCAWIYPNADPEDLWEIIQMKQRTSDTEAQIKIKKKIQEI